MAVCFFLFLLNLLFFPTDISLASGPVRTSCHRGGNFASGDVGYALSASVLAVVQVDSAVQCAFNCVKHDQCKSYNYQHDTTTQSHDCELLDKTKAGLPLAARLGYTYYEAKQLQCPGIACQNGGSCYPNCQTDELIMCACISGFEGTHCEVAVPPHVEIPPKSQIFVPFETALIDCYSSKASKFIWFKDGVALDTMSSQNLNILSNGSLEIVNYTASDNGVYHCNVSNGAGSNVSMSAKLQELHLPEASVHRKFQLATTLFYATLSAKIRNSATVTAWYKNGVEITASPGGRISISSDGNLAISSPKLSDSGNYSFKASNARGTVFSDVNQLTVLAACPVLDHPVNGFRKGFHVEGHIVHIQCRFKYTLTGSDTLVCQRDSTWNGTIPTCSEDTSSNHPVRLTGSTNDNEGRVEIFSGGRWGAIGHDDWDINEATVVCKQLGFPSALRAYKYSAFGAGTGPIFLNNVGCAGHESQLHHCNYNDKTELCSHNKTAGVLCQNARLVAGGHHYGRVEVYTGGRWGTVCDDLWDMMDTHVLCRQLGFSSGGTFGGAQGAGAGDIVLDDLKCSGRESNLMHCPYITSHNCGHGEDISVSCHLFRLVGSPRYYEGRVELFDNGAWGTICDDDWDANEAAVVCKDLGFPGYVEHKMSAFYGKGTGAILYDNVACIGSEVSLADCPRGVGHNCGHGEDAGAKCQAHVRLAGSSNYYEGTVETFKDGTWGTVCDHSWDINDAHVVCRMLGFQGAVAAYSSAHFGQMAGTIHYDGLECDGTESRLLFCPETPSGTCAHANDAGVRCQVLRLAGTAYSNEGRVELFQNEQWGTLCDDPFSPGEAALICFQIGRSAYADYWENAFYGEGSGPIQMKDISCVRTENSIFDCTHSTDTTGCTHANDISVRCNSATKLNTLPNRGLIRVFRDNQWARVCANHWDNRDAEVACREMGFVHGAIEAYKEPRESSPLYAIIRAGLHCEGNETSLADCRQEPVPVTCTHEAGVVCQDLQLVGTGQSHEGRLEIFRSSSWGTICDLGWSHIDATVACRQLGFEAGIESWYSAGTSLAIASGVVRRSQVWCLGLEKNVNDCPSGDDFTDCTHANDVWIKCRT